MLALHLQPSIVHINASLVERSSGPYDEVWLDLREHLAVRANNRRPPYLWPHDEARLQPRASA